MCRGRLILFGEHVGQLLIISTLQSRLCDYVAIVYDMVTLCHRNNNAYKKTNTCILTFLFKSLQF